MAVVALVAGNDVTRRFTGGHDVIVTRVATAGHRRVIHECHGAPRIRSMTVTANLRALHMPRALAGRLDCPDCRVTANAVGTRTFELSTGVTAVARNVDVGAVKVETRTEMIEQLLRIDRGSSESHPNQTRKEQR